MASLERAHSPIFFLAMHGFVAWLWIANYVKLRGTSLILQEGFQEQKQGRRYFEEFETTFNYLCEALLFSLLILTYCASSSLCEELVSLRTISLC